MVVFRAESGDVVQFSKLDETDIVAINELDDAFEGNGWSTTQIADTLTAPSGFAYGLRSDQGLIAFSLYSVVMDEAELLNIGVSSRVRRQGFGQHVLVEGLRSLTGLGVTSVHLEVRASNVAASSLYAKLGFEETGCRRGYYPGLEGREDAILMTLPWLDTAVWDSL